MRHEEPRARGPTEADLRKQAEQRAAASEAVPHAPISFEETARLLHELQVHQIELEMQNEELRTAQAENEAGQVRYLDLYDLAPVGYCTLSRQGLILEANLTAAALLGTARGALVKQPISRFIVRDDRDDYDLYSKQLFASGKPQECELRLVKANGTVFWAHLSATSAHAEDGAPICRVALSDITERKRTEVKTQHLTQVLLAIRNVNQLITKEDDPQRLINGACTNLTETLGYHNAWIALLDGDGLTVSATANAGLEGQFNELRQQLARREFPACMRQALEMRATAVVSDPRSECADCPLARDYGGRAGFMRQLAFADKTYGILAVSVPAAFARDAEEQSLFDEVADDLGFALHKIELQARLREADSRVRTKLNALLAPEGDVGELSLADVLDVPAIQAMMDNFLTLTGFGVAILDVRGKVLVATDWQDICTKFHRVHPETRRHCIESDTELSSGVEPGAFKFYRCKNDLWDVSTPIMLGDRHAGNVFFGQFFFEDETPDREVFRARARQCGFDEEAYLAALDDVPRWSRERVGQIMAFYAALARQLSDLSYGNIRLARTLTQRNELMGRLGQNEERLRLALKATNDVVWDWDIVHDAQRWNESGATVFGWTDIFEAPQTSTWWVDRIHPEDRSRVDRTFFSAVNDPAADRWRDEYRFRKADGAYACVVDRGHILRDADGRAIRMVGAMLDITERKRAEEAQRETSMRLQESVRAANIGLWDWDLSTNRVHFSREWKRQIGYGDAEIGDAFEEWESRVHPEDLAPALEKVRVAITGASQRYQAEFRFRHKDGSYRWIVAQCSVSRDETGKAVRVVGSHLDLTEYKQVEEALRESETRFRFLVDSSCDVIWTLTSDGVFSYVSPSWKTKLGHEPSDTIGKAFHLFVHPDEVAACENYMSRVLDARTALPGPEYRVRHADGSWRWYEAAMTPVYARDGSFMHFVGVSRDIAEQKRAREEVARSAALLRDVVDMVPAYICAKNSEGRFLLVNRKLADFYGIPVATMTGMLHAEMCEDKEELHAMLAADRLVMESGRSETIPEETMKKPDGSLTVLETFKIPFAADGKPAVLIASADITERKRVEEALRESEARFRSYIEHSPYGVFVTDVRGRYVDVNPAAERFSGYSAAQLTSMSISDLLAAESRERGLEQFRTLVATGRASVELGFRHADGGLRYWSVSAIRIGPDRYLGFVEDITERKEGEARMALLGRMLDDAPAAITIHDANGRFLFCNRQNVLLHGCASEEEFLSINLHELDMPESEALLAERAQQVAERGEARFEVTHYRKDGLTFPLDVTAKAIEWRGQPAVLSIAIDTTERKRVEEEREKLQAQFLQAQKMEAVGRLAGGVAHDFNNMLMGILGYAELCRDEVGPEHPIREWLDEITHGAERSANLTRQLLAFARKQTIAPQAMNLNDGVEGMLKMLRHLIGEDKDLAWQPGATLWSVKIDPGQIDQILANLCLNARDAIGGVGRIMIETQNATIDDAYCAAHVEAAPGDYVMLAVSDTGCGMDADTREHIFEPFFTTKGVGEGTGLGLATVYGIVKQNRGIVNVYSEPGEGTTLRIYLPRFEEAVGTAKSPEKHSAPPGGTETVLLVEDEKSVRVITALALERLGYDVMTAATPDEALRKVAEEAGAIHLLITDVVMPGMSGRDLAAKLSTLRPLMKCLFISGYTADAIAQRGILDEDVHFLAKPFSRDDLARKVRRVLRRERERGATGHRGTRRASDTSDLSDDAPQGASG